MLGTSGGRSVGNPTAREARRRASQRERELIDAPGGEYGPLEKSLRSRRIGLVALLAIVFLAVTAGTAVVELLP